MGSQYAIHILRLEYYDKNNVLDSEDSRNLQYFE